MTRARREKKNVKTIELRGLDLLGPIQRWEVALVREQLTTVVQTPALEESPEVSDAR